MDSAQIATAALLINLILGTPAAFVYARYLFPESGSRSCSHHEPTRSNDRADHADLHDAAIVRLIGSKLAIILIHAVKALPFTVLILSVFFRKMPHELFEAAVIDGCTRFQSFLRIAVPMALAPMAATGLFAFMLSYAEFMFSMVLSGDADSRPASVVMAALARNPDVS